MLIQRKSFGENTINLYNAKFFFWITKAGTQAYSTLHKKVG